MLFTWTTSSKKHLLLQYFLFRNSQKSWQKSQNGSAFTGVRGQEIRKGTLLNSGKRLENSNVYREMIFCDVNKIQFFKKRRPY